jgi:non-ribosomal peptide synthetase component F
LYCQQDDIVVGTSASQRDDERWSNVVGLFVNVMALRVHVSGDLTFANHLANVRQTLLDAMAHQTYPFPALVKRLALPRTLRHSPVFQAFMNFLQDRAGELGGLMTPGGKSAVRFGGSTLRPFMVIPQEDGLAEIALSIGQNEDRFAGNLIYNEDLLDRATAQAMADSFLDILEKVVEHPDWPIGDLVAQAGQSGEREELML